MSLPEVNAETQWLIFFIALALAVFLIWLAHKMNGSKTIMSKGVGC